MIIWIAFIGLPVVITLIVFLLHERSIKARPCPGPRGLPIIGHTNLMQRNKHRILELFQEFQKQYSGGVYLSNIFTTGIILFEPEDIKHCMYTNFDNYTREGMNRNKMWYKWLGGGIFNAWGKSWKEQRKTARPLFYKKILEEMVPGFVENSFKVIDIVNASMKKGESIDVQDLYFRYTLDTFGKVGFGEELNAIESNPQFASSFDMTQSLIMDSYRSVFTFFFGSSEFDKHLAIMDKAIYGFIKNRRKLPQNEIKKRKDLLSRFMCLRDENGREYTDEFFRDIFMNFLIAGRDTTAALLSWTTYMLSQHPEWERKLVNEINEHFPGMQVPDPKEYSEMPILNHIIKETLRLYPPVPFNGRFLVNDDVLPKSGFKLKAGQRVRFPIYLLHRDPQLWEDAEKWKPERWEDPNLLKHPFQFVPFHAGPQICLGKGLALMEAKTLLCMLLQRFKFEAVKGHIVKPVPVIILKAKFGIKMHVHPRNT